MLDPDGKHRVLQGTMWGSTYMDRATRRNADAKQYRFRCKDLQTHGGWLIANCENALREISPARLRWFPGVPGGPPFPLPNHIFRPAPLPCTIHHPPWTIHRNASTILRSPPVTTPLDRPIRDQPTTAPDTPRYPSRTPKTTPNLTLTLAPPLAQMTSPNALKHQPPRGYPRPGIQAQCSTGGTPPCNPSTVHS